MIQRILGEIDTKGLRLRSRLSYVLAAIYLIGLSAFCIAIVNNEHSYEIIDLVSSVPLFIICGCVFLFTRSKMKDLQNFSLEEATSSINRQFAAFVLSFLPYCVLATLILTSNVDNNRFFQVLNFILQDLTYLVPIVYMTLVHNQTIKKQDKLVKARQAAATRNSAG